MRSLLGEKNGVTVAGGGDVEKSGGAIILADSEL